MKNYIKPSIELTKFDVEDIITVSGVVGTELTAPAQALYTQYLADNTAEEAASNIVEFKW